MSPLYLYCVTPAAHSPPERLLGLGDAPVHALSHGDLAVWVSAAEPDALGGGIQAIERHNAVVEAALTPTVTPIPLRFGQQLADAEAVRGQIARQTACWRERLALLAGALEFGIRVIDPAAARAARDVRPPPETGGRAYLEQLASRRAGEREVREEVDRVAGVLSRAVERVALRQQVEPLRTGRGVASIAHLVPRASFSDYRQCIGRARSELPSLRLLVSGPWPPYSFAA